jgi:hypothetical protein
LADWTVLVPADGLRRADEVAASLHAVETSDGFVAITAEPPLGLSGESGEGRGPQLTMGDADPREGALRPDTRFRVVILWPLSGACHAEGGLSNVGGATVYSSKCLGGDGTISLFASIYGDRDFVTAVASGLEAREVRPSR